LTGNPFPGNSPLVRSGFFSCSSFLTVKPCPFISSAAQIAAARSIIATMPGVDSTG